MGIMPPADYYAQNREKCRVYNKAWAKNNPEKIKQYIKKFKQRADYSERRKAYRQKFLSKQSNETDREWQRRTFNRRKRSSGRSALQPTDLTWPTHCPVFGYELDYTGQDPIRGWSIDRLNPAHGYVPGNVAIISRLANTIKSNATSTQIRQVADWLDTQTFMQD